jgi:hypothetical protein
MTDPTKAKIQELCPGVMDCQVCGSNVIHNSVCMNCRDTVVVGSPITLAVVLRAIKALKEDNAIEFGVRADGHFLMDFCEKTAWVDGGETPVIWNLEHDNYDQQSEECKQFIGSLLTNEK